MSPLGRHWPRLVCLLTVLWAVGRTGADQPPPPAAAGTSPDPDLLLNLIGNEVASIVQPLVKKLTTRIDRLNSRLIDVNARLTGIETRLNALDFSHDSVNSRLDELVSRVDSVNVGLGSRLDNLTSRVDSAQSMLNSRLEGVVSQANSTNNRLGSRIDELASRVESTENRLDARLNELASQDNLLVDSQNSLLYNISFRLKEHSSLLDNVTSRLEKQSFRLDNVPSHLDQQSSRLDSLANLTDLGSPHDCSQLPAWLQSGIYRLRLNHSQPAVPAYCEQDTEGRWWTVIQRRADIQPRQDFYRYWSDYREGFGDLNKEFWWGLEKVWQMTGATGRQHQLRIELADFDGGRRHALYGRFSVSSEADGYRLSVANYSGNAGDSLNYHNGMLFSTKDRDQDRRDNSCAQSYKGAWWFNACYFSHLNGQYLPGKREKAEGVIWTEWKGWSYSLKETVMKIRPVTTD